MNMNNLVDDAASEIKNSISSSLTDSDVENIKQIIQDKLSKAVNLSSDSCTSAVVMCCGPESDLTHKIEQEVKMAQNALIANLNSMR